MITYKEFLEKQLAAYQKKFDEAEAGHNETGEKRYYNAMKKHKMFIRVFESAIEDEKSEDGGKAEYRRKCKNLYQYFKNVSQYEDPARAVQLILGILSQEVN